MKTCSQCKDTKLSSEFNKDRSRKDGLRGYCKSCQNIMNRKYRQTEHGRIVHRKGNIYYQKTEKYKIAHRKGNKRFSARHPNYIKAVRAINSAVRAKKLPRPDTLLCYYCPKPAQEYHHWHGYEKEHWLDVIPACIDCHRRCDKKIA